MASFLFIVSCSNNKKEIVSNNGKTSLNTDSLKQVFCPVINGVWVQSVYIDEIEKTKSPQKSSNKFAFISAITINESIKSDSINMGVSLGNHEGFGYTVYFETGQNNNSLKTNIIDYENPSNFYELGYEKIKSGIYLFIYHYDKNNRLLDKTKYTKVSLQIDDDMAYGIQLVVNEKIFSGEYFYIDSTNVERQVIFKTDGSVSGLLNFKTYYILTDFATSPEDSPDIVIFDLYQPSSKEFAFQIKKDSIFLYNYSIKEDDKYRLDSLVYTFVRQK
ncbi:hypothetical protein FACS189434_04680 [Bacteroidia bacterium]|nr:hypothetical protein FACS189434_04680 [Bacteroidia bacterium]